MATHKCMHVGCGLVATCIPRIVVKPRPLCIGQPPPFGSVMGLPLCDKHFADLEPRDFLVRDEVRAEIDDYFRAANSLPDYKGASIDKIWSHQGLFRDWERFAAMAEARGINPTQAMN